MKDDKKCMLEDFTEHVTEGLSRRYPERFPPGAFTFEAYLEAASISASRAFYIGEVAGEALVPWADMFNHRTDNEHVHVLGTDDDDKEEEEDGGEDGEDGDEEEEEEEDDAEEEEEEEDEEAEEEEEEEEEEEGPIEPPQGKLMIHVVKRAKKGDELFNTFGQQNNASLLHKYGFCEVDNAHTTVTIDASLVVDVVGSGARMAAHRIGLDLVEEPYFEIAPDGEIEDALFALLGRFHRPKGSKEDAAPDSPQVLASLSGILEKRASTYPDADVDAPAGKKGKKVTKGEEDVDPPAGGGVVGRAAAIALRKGERALLASVADKYKLLGAGGGDVNKRRPPAAADDGGDNNKKKRK